jgi:hypothetical protein
MVAPSLLPKKEANFLCLKWAMILSSSELPHVFAFAFDGTSRPASGAAPLGLPLVVFYLPVCPDQTSLVPLDSGLLGPPASND